LKININDIITFGTSYWKFNNELLEDNDFIETFEFYWKVISRTDNITLQWWDKMKLLIQEYCIDYSRMKNREKYGVLKSLRVKYQKSDNVQ
jgi:hypothetical protein